MNKFTILTVAALVITTLVQAQSDLVVGTTFPLNIQNKNTYNDIFLLHNARYNSGDEVLQWETTHGSFGLRGLRFHTNSGIHFYAASGATSTGATFTPVTRFFIGNNGNIGIGTTSPAAKLDVAGTYKLGSAGTVLTNMMKTSVSFNDNTSFNYTGTRQVKVTVTGATPNATVIINPRTSLPTGIGIAWSRVDANNSVTIAFTNSDVTARSIGNVTLDITVIQ